MSLCMDEAAETSCGNDGYAIWLGPGWGKPGDTCSGCGCGVSQVNVRARIWLDSGVSYWDSGWWEAGAGGGTQHPAPYDGIGSSPAVNRRPSEFIWDGCDHCAQPGSSVPLQYVPWSDLHTRPWHGSWPLLSSDTPHAGTATTFAASAHALTRPRGIRISGRRVISGQRVLAAAAAYTWARPRTETTAVWTDRGRHRDPGRPILRRTTVLSPLPTVPTPRWPTLGRIALISTDSTRT